MGDMIMSNYRENSPTVPDAIFSNSLQSRAKVLSVDTPRSLKRLALSLPEGPEKIEECSLSEQC